MKPEYQMLEFEDQAGWRQWLSEHGSSTDGIWMRFYKKASGVATITYAQALDEALCYGWIDGQAKKYDESSYIQKFTPRRKASMWSKRNIEYVARLTEAGLMTSAGQAEVDRAKHDGRWDRAYDKPSEMSMPEYFLDELRKYPRAYEFFESLNKTNKYAIAWRLQTAASDATRARRQAKLLEMLKAGQKLH